MKKILSIIALCLLLSMSALFAVACNPENNTQHEHTFDMTNWESDDTYHWHKATCEHTSEMNGRAAHTFSDGECTVCHYKQGNTSSETDGHDFKVTVLGIDGEPYVDGATLQICKVKPEPYLCYDKEIPLDANGVCYLDTGKNLAAEITVIEVHVHSIPSSLTHDPVTMNKGEAAVIQLVENLNLVEGTGKGEFTEDGVINSETFNPFKMSEGSSRVSVDATTMFIEFSGDNYPEIFKISVSGATCKIIILDGLDDKGIVKTEETEEGENPEMEFSMTEEMVDAGDKAYIMLEFAESEIGKAIDIKFEYVKDIETEE